ncbi:MAG: hypothetical protein AAFX40_07665 [Cyanobacteria bacterium J06639_1]
MSSLAERRRQEERSKTKMLAIWLAVSAMLHVFIPFLAFPCRLPILREMLFFLCEVPEPEPDLVTFTIVDPSDLAPPEEVDLQANANSVDSGEARPEEDPSAGRPSAPQEAEPAPQQQAVEPLPPPPRLPPPIRAPLRLPRRRHPNPSPLRPPVRSRPLHLYPNPLRARNPRRRRPNPSRARSRRRRPNPSRSYRNRLNPNRPRPLWNSLSRSPIPCAKRRSRWRPRDLRYRPNPGPLPKSFQHPRSSA